jgi:hypothetical protein
MIKTVKTLIILSSPFTDYEMHPQFDQARFLLSYVCSSKGWRTVHHKLPSLSLNNDTILCAPVRLGYCHSRSHHCPISPRISHPLAPPFITYLSHKSSSHVFRSFENNPVPDNNHLTSFVSEELLNLDTTVPNICEEPESSVTASQQCVSHEKYGSQPIVPCCICCSLLQCCWERSLPPPFYAILLPTILFSLSLSSSNLFHCSLSMPQPSLYIHPSTNTLRIFVVKEYERRG